MRTLRDYQARSKVNVATLVAAGYNPLWVMPTGGGKTYSAASLVEELQRPTLWVAHRRELIDQAARQLMSLGLRVGVIMAGEPENHFAQVQVASVQTLARRGIPATRDWVIVIDEAHHTAADSYQALFDVGAPVVGLTATPFRLDGAGLGDLFGSLVVAATPAELVAAGVLVRPRVLCAPAPSMDDARILAGDYSVADAAVRFDTQALVGDVVDTWRKRASDRARTLAFAINVVHSRHIADSFNAAGIPAAHIDGETDPDERDDVLARLRAGTLRVVSNVALLTEGWDLPALDCLVVARPTNSLGLHQQIVGRVMRSHDGKDDALVLDHAGNHLRHGEIVRDLEYSLTSGAVPRSSSGPGVRACPKCYRMFPNTGWVCPECGFDCAPPPPTTYVTAGDLRDFRDAPFEDREAEWNKIEYNRVRMGFKEGWAAYEYKRLFQAWPLLVGRRLIDPENASVEERAAIYTEIDVRRKQMEYDPGWTAVQYKSVFGGWPTPDVRGTVEREASAKAVATVTQAWAPRQWAGKARLADPARPSRAGTGPDPEEVARPAKPWLNMQPKTWEPTPARAPVTDDEIPF